MPEITTLRQESLQRRVDRAVLAPHRPGGRWLAAGLTAVVVLALVDLIGGLVNGRASANISGTFALCAVLTGLGGSRVQTVVVGVCATAVATALVIFDGVPLGTGAVRTLVVVVASVVAVVAVSIRNSQLAHLQDRRQAARTLQAAMLTTLPEPDHLQLTSRYLPASVGDQVGGDWYDAVVDSDGCTVLVIGDVTGHDIHAAAAMGQVRGLLRGYAIEAGQSPVRVLERVDSALSLLGLDVLATVAVLRIEQDEAEREAGLRRIRWANAGHPPPLRVRGRSAELLDAAPDLLLGLSTEAGRREHSAVLEPEDTLLLYTDGLVERRDRSTTVGLEELARAGEQASGLGLEEFVDAVLARMLGSHHGDDVAVLAVRAHPEDGPRPVEAGPSRRLPGPPRPAP